MRVVNGRDDGGTMVRFSDACENVVGWFDIFVPIVE